MESELFAAINLKNPDQKPLECMDVEGHYRTIEYKHVLERYCEKITEIDFIYYLIPSGLHAAVPIVAPTGDHCIQAVGAQMEIITETILAGFFQKITQNTCHMIPKFIAILEKYFPSNIRYRYFINLKLFQKLREELEELWKPIEDKPMKSVRNVGPQGFTVEDLKKELKYLGYTKIFPEITALARSAYTTIFLSLKSSELKTCELFAAIQGALTLVLTRRYPCLNKFVYRQKVCLHSRTKPCDFCLKAIKEAEAIVEAEIKAETEQASSSVTATTSEDDVEKVEDSEESEPESVTSEALSIVKRDPAFSSSKAVSVPMSNFKELQIFVALSPGEAKIKPNSAILESEVPEHYQVLTESATEICLRFQVHEEKSNESVEMEKKIKDLEKEAEEWKKMHSKVFEENIRVVGYIPETGFPARNNSKFALKYLQYLDNEDPSLKLEHALSKGEKRIFYGEFSYYVDGFSEATNTVYEVYGCMYHGCRECFKARSMRSPCNPNSTFEDLYQQTILRQSHIENAGFKVEAKWECEIKKELDSNKKMKQFFIECRHTSQLNPRDSMYGGRTQPFQAFAKADSMNTIQYFDFCSLYPHTNMIGAEYPKGQPEVIRTDFLPIVVGSVPYRGLIFCDILPPKDLGIPVLPYKTRSKLLFPLCRTCAERPSGSVCTHNEENQRYLTGTWVSEEINLAIKMGYKILKYHEVWHWSDRKWFTGGFFKSFLQPLLKIKHEASGWPSEVTTDVEKQKHIDTIYENDGVLLDADKVKKNPALRQMSKLFLNSAWGKFAQNPQKVDMQLMDVEDGSGVFNFLNSSLHEPTCLQTWGDHHLLVARKPLKDSVKTPRFCNVVYGSITTALARIRLYEALNRVGAKNLIYCDTDSVMFLQPVGVDLLGDLCGDGLGKLTNEVKQGMRITEVVTTAPKVYAYCLEDENGQLSYEIKAKGMTLNCATRDNVTFDNMKNMMLKHVKKQQYTPLRGQKVSLTRGIKRPLDAPHSKLVVKRMKPVADKGHVLDDGSIIPYGYSTDKTPIIKNYPF
ncbi:unnamed protein product [Caenorhabditis brenneri]